jgi:hypothetical protein
MNRKQPAHIPGEGHIHCAPLSHGIGWGFLGGLAGTLAMDLLLIGVFLATKSPPLLCFTIVGDTLARFFSMLGVEMAGGVLPGMATHYVVGPIVGMVFGAAVAYFPAPRAGALKKRLIVSFLYVEILSQPLLATAPILLKMKAPEILQWYGGAFGMHLVMSMVLGSVVAYGLRLLPPPAET